MIDDPRMMGTISGAASGAAAGSMIAPGVGTVIGAGVGALLGFGQGSQQAESQKAAQEAQRKIQQEQYNMRLNELNAQIQNDKLMQVGAEKRHQIVTSEGMSQMGGVPAADNSNTGSLTSGTF